MRVLARHQWVRDHGTPRVTTLAGSAEAARALWTAWLTLTARGSEERLAFVQPASSGDEWLTEAATKAFAIATRAPHEPVVLVVEPEALARWLKAHADRLAVFIAEGVLEVEADEPSPVRSFVAVRARSEPELRMFEALEASPSTAGQFQLNQTLSFHFGGRAVEADLLARAHDLVVEIDGYRHFTDAAHYRRDREKDLMVQAHGYAVLRFLADDVLADASKLVQTIVKFIGIKAGARRAKKG